MSSIRSDTAATEVVDARTRVRAKSTGKLHTLVCGNYLKKLNQSKDLCELYPSIYKCCTPPYRTFPCPIQAEIQALAYDNDGTGRQLRYLTLSVAPIALNVIIIHLLIIARSQNQMAHRFQHI